MQARPNATNHNGQRVARLFRQACELGDTRRCDLDALLTRDDIEILTSSVRDPGYVACLMRAPGERGGGIWLAPGQSSGRMRFSIAHELGHYHIPTHRHKTFGCADRDLRSRSTTANNQEWEANDFAAELLMPKRLFTADVERVEISIEAVRRLAAPERYDVSTTAAAWRLIQTTREACALVVSTDGIVEWIVKSDSFHLRLNAWQQPLHPETHAAGVLRGIYAEEKPHEVMAAAWLETAQLNGALLESTHHIPSLKQVLSLLWVVNDDNEEVGDSV